MVRVMRIHALVAVFTISCGPSVVGNEADDGGGGGGGGGGGDSEFADGAVWEGDPETCAHAETSQTYVGCDFYPTVHPNVVKAYFDFAVVVANAGDTPGEVVIERDGVPITSGPVPANGLSKFFLPWVGDLKHFTAMCDTDIFDQPPPLDSSKRVPGGAFHLTSTVPVTVYQFNPLEFKGEGGPPGKDWSGCEQCWPGCNSYTNDASLLLPSTALTGSYVVTAQSGIDTEEIRSPGYVIITGLHPSTHVDVKVGPAGVIRAGGGIAGAGPDEVTSFDIDRGEVVVLLGTPGTDLGGTLVRADLPVQVMTGVPHIYLPFDRQSSDHIEEVVFPVETLGSRYMVARPTGPRGDAVPHSVRIFGVSDATQLSYPGPAPAGAPSTIARGQVVDLGMVDTDFEIVGDTPFQLATYQLGQTIVDPSFDGRGDPSQSAVAALEQFRDKYVFLAPDDYDVSYADVVMPMGAQVTVDGQPITAAVVPIASGYGIARIELGPGEDGAHLLEADTEVGLQVMGYGYATSYQYPGGLNLMGIAPPLPEID
jgi:hypothetical protein